MPIDSIQLDRSVAIFDTSGVLDLLWAAVRHRPRQEFERAIHGRVAPDAQCAYHAITLAELATNTHEEVLQGRPRAASQTTTQQVLQREAERFRRALEALQYSLRGGWHELLPFRMIPVTPSLGSFVRLSRERADYRNLRCLRKSGVVPLASMVDHQILSLAFAMREQGTPVTFVSGDRELLGAAAGLGIPWIDSKVPGRIDAWPWKDCGRDEKCIAGCTDGVSDCQRMFATAPIERSS